MGTRQRQIKLKDQETTSNESSNSSSGKIDKSAHMSPLRLCAQNKYPILAILGLSVLVYICLAKHIQEFSTKTVDNLVVSFNLHTTVYVIVLDAGSTASRVNAYSFHNSMVSSQLILDDTLFYETKPGLTSYAKNPRDVEKSLNTLLDKAKSKIPRTSWASTPIILRATAGLRLLPDNESQSILRECKRVLVSSGFKVLDDSVAIMSGSDEGIFSWFTTNFILKKLSPFGNDDELAKNTVVALDLGGGSTQVTFAVTPPQAGGKKIYQVNTFGRNISIFTESFLGLGLMAARKEILTHPDNYKNGGKDVPAEKSTAVELRAECVNPLISGAAWNYAGKDYKVMGPSNGSYKVVRKNPATGLDERKPVVRFASCLEIIKKVVDAAVPRELPSLGEREIYAFSYYFERAAEAGLVDPFKGGMVTIESIYKSASEICAYPNVDQPFMCLDLSFIYVLLRDGFGLEKSTKVFMHKYIDGHQLNWGLGAAFNILQTDS